MLRTFAAAFALVCCFTTMAAAAACGGSNLLEKLKADDPATAKALQDKAAAIINANGRFWKVEKPGVAPSYVYGTFHVAKAVEFVPDAAWAALEGARVAIFEVSLTEKGELQKRMASDPSILLADEGRPFAARMSAKDAEKVLAAFEARGVPQVFAERLQPWMQISMLALPACALASAASDPMVDMVLANRADAKGIPQIGLETPQQALDALARLSDDVITTLVVAAGRGLSMEEDVFQTNLDLYRDGQIALIRVLNDWIADQNAPDLKIGHASERMYASLLDRRNREWMPRVLNEVGKGNAFVAVGALHLVGEIGLIAALERDGYTATPLD